MSIYEKPVRLLMKDFVKDKGVTKGQVITRDQVLKWFKTNYSLIKASTVSAHLIRMSTNAPSRFHYNANPNGDDDLFFQIDGSHFRLYEPANDPAPIYDGESKPRNTRKVAREGYSFFNSVEHPILKERLSRLSNAPLDTIIREAGVIFESSLRSAGNLNSGQFGVRLVDELLEPGGKLVFSSHGGEQQGIQYLFRGAMQFIRNPPMHKIIDYPESVAKQYIRLIDALLLLLDQATHVEEVTVDDIRVMLRRKRIAPGQLDLYRALYEAGSKGLVSNDLALAINKTPQQLSGVLGALGRRINQTKRLEDKGGTLIVFEVTETNDGGWLYVMRPVLRKALELEGIV
jgi:hypothetical protein